MKKIICSLCIAMSAIAFFSCASASVAESKPIEFTEVAESDVYNAYSFSQKAETGIRGMKLNTSNVSFQNEKLKINQLIVDASDFCRKTPDFFDRLETGRTYTVYLKVAAEGNFWFGYTYTPVLENIEGLRTVEEIADENRRKEEKRLAKEKAELELKEQQIKERKNKIEKLAQGYTIHGLDEAGKNALLFNKGALQAGHAYYISDFMIKGGGELGGAIASIFSSPEYRYIKYISQTVREEVTLAGETLFGTFPVSVVVAGGNPPLNTPVVLGLIE